jgi:hypothetical protein
MELEAAISHAIGGGAQGGTVHATFVLTADTAP